MSDEPNSFFWNIHISNENFPKHKTKMISSKCHSESSNYIQGRQEDDTKNAAQGNSRQQTKRMRFDIVSILPRKERGRENESQRTLTVCDSLIDSNGQFPTVWTWSADGPDLKTS